MCVCVVHLPHGLYVCAHGTPSRLRSPPSPSRPVPPATSRSLLACDGRVEGGMQELSAAPCPSESRSPRAGREGRLSSVSLPVDLEATSWCVEASPQSHPFTASLSPRRNDANRASPRRRRQALPRACACRCPPSVVTRTALETACAPSPPPSCLHVCACVLVACAAAAAPQPGGPAVCRATARRQVEEVRRVGCRAALESMATVLAHLAFFPVTEIHTLTHTHTSVEVVQRHCRLPSEDATSRAAEAPRLCTHPPRRNPLCAFCVCAFLRSRARVCVCVCLKANSCGAPAAIVPLLLLSWAKWQKKQQANG